MKRTYKSMMGVTLLEIMLVLAIAALVIVMSIRFYQSASSSQKVNSMISLTQGIVAAGENYFNANGSSYNNVATGITTYLPGNIVPNSPWGSKITIGGNANILTISLTTAIPTNDCTPVINILKQNSHFTPTPTCTKITYTQ